LKLPESDILMSKHVGVNFVRTDSVVIYNCALVGSNINNKKIH